MLCVEWDGMQDDSRIVDMVMSHRIDRGRKEA